MDNSTVNNLIGDYTDNPSYEDYKNYQLDDLFCFRCSTKVFYEIHDIGRDSSSERGIPYPYVCLDCDENMEWEEVVDKNGYSPRLPEFWNGWKIDGDSVEQKSKEESNYAFLWNDTTLQQKQKFLCLVEALSPENLYEDGMISDADGDLKYEQLMKQWRLLEKEIEREVTEEEIWEQLAFTDLYIDDNDLDAIVRFDLRKNKWLIRKDY